MSSTNQSQETTTYFNLHTSGIGYLNRIREVPVRRGPPFIACDVAALHGASDAVEYTFFDCRVSGTEAERLIRQHWEAVKAGKKVLLSFRIGDLWVRPFLYEQGNRQGQPGASLKGRLIFIEWIKVDGKLEYKAPARQEATAPAERMPDSEPETTLDAPIRPADLPVHGDTTRTAQPA